MVGAGRCVQMLLPPVMRIGDQGLQTGGQALASLGVGHGPLLTEGDQPCTGGLEVTWVQACWCLPILWGKNVLQSVVSTGTHEGIRTSRMVSTGAQEGTKTARLVSRGKFTKITISLNSTKTKIPYETMNIFKENYHRL